MFLSLFSFSSSPQGTDPAADLYKFAEEMKFHKKLSAISLGQGQVRINTWNLVHWKTKQTTIDHSTIYDAMLLHDTCTHSCDTSFTIICMQYWDGTMNTGYYTHRVPVRKQWCVRVWIVDGGCSSRTATSHPAGCLPWSDWLSRLSQTK